MVLGGGPSKCAVDAHLRKLAILPSSAGSNELGRVAGGAESLTAGGVAELEDAEDDEAAAEVDEAAAVDELDPALRCSDSSDRISECMLADSTAVLRSSFALAASASPCQLQLQWCMAKLQGATNTRLSSSRDRWRMLFGSG